MIRYSSEGAQALLWEQNNQNNQKFKFVRQSDGTYGIICVASGKALEADSSGANSSNVYQWTWDAVDLAQVVYHRLWQRLP
ncbi:MAG: RICIN domain-containing protein [Oscillospiraceae bacterium]|nr:RICIN domain-containing protein [Oscillospiraceae bacterium]